MNNLLNKIALTLILVLNFLSYSVSQNICDKEWRKFHVEKLDGSRFVERNNLLTTQIRYTFRNNGDVEIWGYFGEGEHKYLFKDSILTIDTYAEYKVEELSDSLLILADITNEQTKKNKANRFYFTTEEKYVNNVLSKGLVNFLNDSIIISNWYLKPIYHYNLEEYLNNSLSSELPKEIKFSGNFILSPYGIVTKVSINGEVNSNNDFENEFIELIYETSYRWNLPDMTRRFYYQNNFTVRVKGNFIEFSLLAQESSIKYSDLTYEEKEQANLLLQKGNTLLKKEKYEKAIDYFTKCIGLDNISIDAFYNRANAFQILERNDKACADWKYLYDLGQVDGINLYIENCKE
jgi:tetratricopeptide (TPR) repeat protein